MCYVEKIVISAVIYLNIVCVLSVPSQSVDVVDESICTTPDNIQGICKDLRKCDDLIAILQKQPLTDTDRTHLQKSQCGVLNQSPLVCCPPTKFNTEYLPKQCGMFASSRIFRGIYTLIDEYPWMALIQYKGPDNKLEFKCSGVLINKDYVITAAHCVHEGNLLKSNKTILAVRLGEVDLATELDCEDNDCADPVQDISIAKIIVHEEFKYSTLNVPENDIALIRLSQPVLFGDFVRPICLQITEHLHLNIQRKDESAVTGWSQDKAPFSSKKLQFNVPNIALDECKKQYKTRNIKIGPKQLCTGKAFDKSHELCQGDSINVLSDYGHAENRFGIVHYLVGIFSFETAPCAADGHPAIYTNISSYTDWILDNLRP